MDNHSFKDIIITKLKWLKDYKDTSKNINRVYPQWEIHVHYQTSLTKGINKIAYCHVFHVKVAQYLYHCASFCECMKKEE